MVIQIRSAGCAAGVSRCDIRKLAMANHSGVYAIGDYAVDHPLPWAEPGPVELEAQAALFRLRLAGDCRADIRCTAAQSIPDDRITLTSRATLRRHDGHPSGR